MAFTVTEHVAKTPRHTTFYLACGPADGPPIIFVHGWPELSASWRHQLPCFGPGHDGSPPAFQERIRYPYHHIFRGGAGLYLK